MKRLLLVLNFVYLSFLLGYSQEVSYLGSKSIGSRNFPTLNSFFGTSYSQSIYLNSELPANLDTIYGIQYQIKSGNINGANQWEVYLGQTTQSSYAFTGPNQYNDFVTNITNEWSKLDDKTLSQKNNLFNLILKNKLRLIRNKFIKPYINEKFPPLDKEKVIKFVNQIKKTDEKLNKVNVDIVGPYLIRLSSVKK